MKPASQMTPQKQTGKKQKILKKKENLEKS